MTRSGGYSKLSSVQRNIAMNPMPVVIDKALLPLELYSVPLPPLSLSSYGVDEYFQTPNEMGWLTTLA